MPSSSNGQWDLLTYQALLKECYSATTPAEKGATLEHFIAYAFEALTGLSLMARNVRTGSEELDLVFWNDQLCDYFRSASAEFLVECKNWASPVGSAEASWFVEKMRQRTVTHGLLVARNGVTGEFRNGRDGAIDTLFRALSDGLRPLVVTLSDLQRLKSPDDLVRLCKQKTLGLMVRQI